MVFQTEQRVLHVSHDRFMIGDLRRIVARQTQMRKRLMKCNKSHHNACNALLAMRCEVAMNLLNTKRRGHACRPIARFYTRLDGYSGLLRTLAKRPENGASSKCGMRGRFHSSRYYGTTPCSRSVRAAVGGNKHAKEPRERRKFTRPVYLVSVAFAAPVLTFLGPSSGRHHGMPFFGFLFFFHPGSVWMAPPRLSCRSIDLSWTPSA